MLLRDYVSKLSESCKPIIINRYYDLLNEEIVIPSSLDSIANFLKALSNNTRLKILYLLAKYQLPVCLIAAILNKDQTLISHHLKTLKEYGLVKEFASGKFKYYVTDKNMIKSILKALLHSIE